MDATNGDKTYLFFSDTSIGVSGALYPQALFHDQSNYKWDWGQAIVTLPLNGTYSVTVNRAQFVIKQLA